MKIITKESLSILALQVAPKVQQPKSKPIAKKYTPPPAPPCMASRQWYESLRAENLKTVEGRAVEYIKDYYHELKMPKDW